MLTPARRFELSTRRFFKYRDLSMPEAIVVSGDGDTVHLVPDMDLPVVSIATLTPGEAEQVGWALIEAAGRARLSQEVEG